MFVALSDPLAGVHWKVVPGVVELAVEARLGTVKLLKITAAHDLGRVINPQLAEGQIEGGIAQGIGMALMEE